MSEKIPLIPGVPFEGPVPVPAPEGVIRNGLSSNTSVPPHKPVLCSAVLADGIEDSWLEYVPEKLPEGKKPPLIISCHGGGAHAQMQFEETSWWCIAESEGAVAVFPNAGGTQRSWLSGDRVPKPGERPSMLEIFTSSPDGRAEESTHHIAFIKALIAEMKRKYDIDESRVYMQGMSMGDIMTMMFSRVCGNLLAGADCTAGPSPEIALFNEDGSVKANCGPVPVYQSRGELDSIVVAQWPGREVTTRQDVNAGNRRYWLEVNGCKILPRIAIRGANNFAFYTGEKANVVFRDVKHRTHGQTLDDAQWAWNTLFKGSRRNPDGTVTCTDTAFTASGDTDGIALADGRAYAYVSNQRVRLEAPAFYEPMMQMDFSVHAYKEYGRELYVPVSAFPALFGAEVTFTQDGQGAVIHAPDGDCEIVSESVACLCGDFLYSMYMPVRIKDGVLCTAVRWFAENVFGLHVTQCDGAFYASGHHGEMTKDMAFLISGILA